MDEAELRNVAMVNIACRSSGQRAGRGVSRFGAGIAVFLRTGFLRRLAVVALALTATLAVSGCGSSTRPPAGEELVEHSGDRSRQLLAERTEMERFMQMESFRREASVLLGRELPPPARVVFEAGRAEPGTAEADSILGRASRVKLEVLPIGPHSDRVQAVAELERVPGRAGASPGIRFVEVSGPFERAQMLLNFDPQLDDPPRPSSGRYMVRLVRENADVFTFVSDDARRALTAGQKRRWGTGRLTIDYEFRDGASASRAVRAFEFGYMAGSAPLPWR